jgi:hypothetical protein
LVQLAYAQRGRISGTVTLPGWHFKHEIKEAITLCHPGKLHTNLGFPHIVHSQLLGIQDGSAGQFSNAIYNPAHGPLLIGVQYLSFRWRRTPVLSTQKQKVPKTVRIFEK